MLKDLRVYQLAVQFYKEIKRVPGMTAIERNQLERAALSVLLNISEGCGRQHRKDRLRFLAIAMGSLRESQALIEVIENSNMADQLDHVAAVLYRFMQNPGGLG